MAPTYSTAPTLALQPAERIIERIEEALRASPGGVLAFDGDGTLWDGDVGEDFFHALVAHGDFREPARAQMERDARTHGVALGGTGKELAARIYDAYLAGRYPEEPVCELMTWCCAGWTASEVDAFAADVLARGWLGRGCTARSAGHRVGAVTLGIEVFLVSASPRAIIEHAGRAIGIDDDARRSPRVPR